MAFIIEIPNPFEPLTNVQKSIVKEGITIRQWLEKRYPGFVEFDVPTICILNGKPLMRDGWDHVIRERDVINFVAVQGGPLAFVVIAVAIAVAAIAVTLFFGVPAPHTPGEVPASDPVFSSKGQQNAIRLGEPIEVPYGKNRIYPSYASRPYYQYVDNDQFQYSLFCIGQGSYDIHAVQIGDTNITSFDEADYQIVEPDGNVTLFPVNVFTSVEVGGQTLFAPNEDDYPVDGWVGPFAACPAGDTCTRIEVDVVLPKGLYFSNDGGGLSSQTVEFEIEAREIDNAGDPLGIWFPLTGSTESITGTTTTPQRRTLGGNTADLRYEVRMRRTNDRIDSHRYGNEIEWEGMKSYVSNDQTFEGVTILAVKIRATDQLNERTQQRFNVVCTRKLAPYESDGFGTAVATRSIVWAFVDVFASAYGGNVDEAFFDWDTLWEMDNEYSDRTEYFDWVFRDPITVWEAARTIARVGRAVPLIVGSLISLKRDGPLETPVAMFTPDNMIEGTLQWDIKLWDIDEYDSIRAEYTEPSTGYKQETVLATLPGGTTNNPRDVRFAGISNRDHAYHEALYMLGVDRYLRENIAFETGMEGYIPTFGDLIIVAHDMPRWAQSGYVVKGEAESNGDYHIWLSEPVTFTEGENHSLWLRNSVGTPLGPYACFETADPMQVRINTLTDLDFLTDGTTEPMLFMFGISGMVHKYCRVVKIEPQDNHVIKVTAVNEDSTIHSFDGLSAPAIEDNDTIPVIPELPEVEYVQITQVDTSVLEVIVSWSATFGSQYYIVQYSEDGVNYTNLATTSRTSYTFPVRPGTLYVRVAAVNLGQGPWAYDVTSITSLAGISVDQDFVDVGWEISWLEVLNAVSYDIKVYDNSSPSTPVLEREVNILKTADRVYTYGIDEAVADENYNREMLVSVTPVFNDGPGTAVEKALSNPIPTAPTSLTATFIEFNSDGDYVYELAWNSVTEDDLIGLKVWLSDTDGFDPAVLTPEYEEEFSGVGWSGISASVQVVIPADSSGEHGPYYWRVGMYDIWGNEHSTNISTQQDIVATSGWAP